MHLRKITLAAIAASLAFGMVSTWLNAKGTTADNTMIPPDGPKVPLGLVEILWPEDNPYTPEKAELGWLLFFDKRLSSDGSVSCASCHSPDHGFTDGKAVSTGIKGQKGGRSAPSVIN